MARIEKTVFISYRRKDISWALAVYQYLTRHKYDVFFDYTSIPSGDFEQIIVGNIRARAHLVLILTPTALDRCSNPGDWLRREIETAMDEKRNIIPLFFDGFDFGNPTVAEKLTGKLSALNRYNGLDIPSGYFMEAMERLRGRYLNIPLNAVIHPIPTEVRKVVKEEQVAADKALREQKSEIKELVKPVHEEIEKQKRRPDRELPVPFSSRWKDVIEGTSSWFKKINPRPFGIGMGVLLLSALGIFGINSLIQNLSARETPSPTQTRDAIVEFAKTPTKPIPTSTATVLPFTPTPELGIGSTMTGVDGMTLLYVPAGEFSMGSEDGEDDEKPVHTVYLDAFWIDQTEITNRMYAHCVVDGGCSELYDDWYFRQDDYADNPVLEASWNNANDYCSWAGRRLPTEAEWEKAARGENAFTYPWGNEPPDKTMANYDYEGRIGYGPDRVGTYPKGASPYGALDMAGNAAEWVFDIYDVYPGGDPNLNAFGEGYRVVRDGDYYGSSLLIRSAARTFGNPRLSYKGFRCAMDASE